jgi:hypothetical protein
MDSNFNNQTISQTISDDIETGIDRLYDTWMSLGMGVNGKHYVLDLDLEQTIAETTHVGRYESRLLWAMLTWIVTYGDLINVSRMMHFLQIADKSVLGAILEIGVKNGGDKKLLNVVKKCIPKKAPELLFPRMKKLGFAYAQELTEAKDEWKKWGYYSSETSFMYDSILGDRMFIFKNQKNLAIRAIFGPNLRAEILFYLYKNSGTYIKAISKSTGFAYFPVYNEIKELVRNGLLRSTTYGRTTVVFLNDYIFRFIQNAPA